MGDGLQLERDIFQRNAWTIAVVEARTPGRCAPRRTVTSTKQRFHFQLLSWQLDDAGDLRQDGGIIELWREALGKPPLGNPLREPLFVRD